MKHLILWCACLVFCLQVNAQSCKEWIGIGKGNFNMGLYEKAITCYNNAMNLEPESRDALYQRAYSYLMMREYDKAISDFTEVIKHHKNDEWAYISRGSAYNKTKQYTKALSDFNKALSINPQNQDAYNNRGWSKKFLGDKEAACKDWHTSKKMGNNEAKIIISNNHCKKKAR